LLGLADQIKRKKQKKKKKKGMFRDQVRGRVSETMRMQIPKQSSQN
jgi:hypothetical protein